MLVLTDLTDEEKILLTEALDHYYSSHTDLRAMDTMGNLIDKINETIDQEDE